MRKKYYRISLVLPVVIILVFLSIIYTNNNIITKPKYAHVVAESTYQGGDHPGVIIEEKDKILYAVKAGKQNSSVDVLKYMPADSDKYIKIKYSTMLSDAEDGAPIMIQMNKLPVKIVSTDTVSPDGFKYNDNSFKGRTDMKHLAMRMSIIDRSYRARANSIDKWFYSKPLPHRTNKRFIAWAEGKDND